MKIGILKETQRREKRVAISPIICKKLIEKGFEIILEDHAGSDSSFKNSAYRDLGVIIEKRKVVFKEADVLIKINPFDKDDLELVHKGQILMSQLFLN